jgi:hypothetical protein
MSYIDNRFAPRALLHRPRIMVELTPLELSMLVDLLETRATIAAHHSEQIDFADFLFCRVAELRKAAR